MTPPPGALDGLRVVDAGLLIQGPQAAALLASWGADVIKVEQPGWGDQSRWLPLGSGTTQSAFYDAVNRGKRSITLDLRRKAGQEVLRRLVGVSDVVISNFRPGTMDGWGLGYEELLAVNPRLIYAAGSYLGPGGDDEAGADLSAQALGGLMTMTGTDPKRPTPVGAAIADHAAAQCLAAGILAALYARERTGRGQRVETSLLGAQVWAQASEITGYLMSGRVGGPGGRGHRMIPGVYGIFSTADGWIAIAGAAGHDRARLFEAVGRPELIEQFPESLYWEDERAVVFPELDEAFTRRTTSAWIEILRPTGIRSAPVRDHAALAVDLTVWANGYLADVEGSTVVGTPVHFSETPAGPGGAPPELGQDTELVLMELGYSWAEIGELRQAQAI